MRRFIGSVSIDEACAKVDGMDIFNNTAAEQIFCQVAIDYSRDELRRDGIELLTVAREADLQTFCRLWLKQHPSAPTDMALIGLTLAIRSYVHAFVQSKRES